VVTCPALVEVDEPRLEPARQDRVIARADLAVVDRVPRVVAVLEEAAVANQPVAEDVARAVDARSRRERAVDRVREWVQERQAPRTRQKGLLRGTPVAGVPVPLEEVLARLPDVADLVEELEHPERLADLVPAERRRRNLLLEVPGEIERVRAVE